jgi:dienelactone hydrolase
MSPPPPARAIYLDGGREPVFGQLHAPDKGAERDTAVLMVPPFGWDDVCSYRSRRDWAEQLAGAGYVTLRMELPGTGDSGGSLEDSDLLGAWIESVSNAARWLSLAPNTTRVAAIGIGMGGLLSCAALAAGAPIEELVLWAVPARGRALIREMRAFGRMERAKFANGRESEQQVLPEGAVGAGGFVLNKETVDALEGLDLLELPAADGHPRRGLMLERDSIGVDEGLRERLETIGAEVRVASGMGYGAMMAEPQEARPPRELFALVESWLNESSQTKMGASSGDNGDVMRAEADSSAVRSSWIAEGARNAAELTVGGVRIRETPYTIEQPSGRLFGVLAKPVEHPSSGLGAVLLNAGAIRRIGPNRMWVQMARSWAARGVPTLRLDLEGLGDSDGDAERFVDVAELYVPELVEQVRGALDELSARGVAQRFVLGGLCSGAYWAFHGALQDERVAAAFMLNPRTLFWDPVVENIRYLRRGLLEPSSWRMILRGDVRLSRMGAVAARAPRSLARRAIAQLQEHESAEDELAVALNQLAGTEKRLVFVFSENEPLHQELDRQGKLERLRGQPNIELELLPGRDHTLRPANSQQSAYEVLDRALTVELERGA